MKLAVFFALCAAVRVSSSGTGGGDSNCDGYDAITSGLTDAEKIQAVDLHNTYRAGEKGANELEMEWDDELAKMAQLRASRCDWAHGDMKRCTDDMRMGQNMYLSTFSSTPTFNISYAIEMWWDEIKDYNKITGSCEPGKVCGHYTQLVWNKSNRVGCGYSVCPTFTMAGMEQSNGMIIVCDYYPTGNIVGDMPVLSGVPCASCTTVIHDKGYACNNFLCEKCVPDENPNCACLINGCENQGIFDPQQCTCTCPSGFGGDRCQSSCNREEACVDLQSPAACQSWQSLCGNPLYRAFMTQNCANTCSNLCDVPDNCA